MVVAIVGLCVLLALMLLGLWWIEYIALRYSNDQED